MSTCCLRVIAACLALPIALPCDRASAEVKKWVRLAVTPAVEPKPSLKYQLLPKYFDRRPGNAAVRYERAALHYRPAAEIDQQVSDWLALSFDEFRKPAVLKQIDAGDTHKIFEELQLAARLQSCEWELPIREQMFHAILLPEVQELRRLGRYTALKARREAAAGKFDEAVATLQVGYAMSRHVAQGPTLVNGLVGTATTVAMDQVLLDLAQMPDAPSLFWALTFQPRPLIDPRPGIEAEMAALMLCFPQMLGVDEKGTQVDAAAALDRLFHELGVLGRFGTDAPPLEGLKLFGAKMAVLAMAALRKEELKEFLVSCNWPKQRVDKLSEAELALAYTRVKYEELRDLQYRWMVLPAWQARAALDKSDQRLRQSAAKHEELLPFGALLLPAVSAVNHAYHRGERRLDALRIIEALRLYAGRNDGRLPDSLDELADLPLPPLDVITGKPFAYVREGKAARLSLPDEFHGLDEERTLTYEITIRAQP